jgi:hypothetical protein
MRFDVVVFVTATLVALSFFIRLRSPNIPVMQVRRVRSSHAPAMARIANSQRDDG